MDLFKANTITVTLESKAAEVWGTESDGFGPDELQIRAHLIISI